MHALMPGRQQGFSLLEVLIAIALTALGLLAMLGVQLRTLADTQASVRRAQAIRLIEDLGERMKTHPHALLDLDAYVMDWAAGTAAPMTQQAGTHCDSAACSHAELAAYDLREWKRAVERALPLGNAKTFVAPAEAGSGADRRQLGVMVRWRENERVTGDDRSDAATYRGATNASLGGGDVHCPAGYTCHLQYLAVGARCAPYLADGAVQLFCPGS